MLSVVSLGSVQRLAFDRGRPGSAADVDLDPRARLGMVGGYVGHPDPPLEARRVRAAGDHAAAHHGVALAGDALALDHERNKLLGRALAADARHHVCADEPGLLLAAP